MVMYHEMKRSGLFKAVRIFLFGLATMIVFAACGSKGSSDYEISGRITAGGAGLAGVTVTLSGDTSKTGITDKDGNYSFGSLSEGIYTVTPSLQGYSFSPRYQIAYIRGMDAEGFDFTGNSSMRIAASAHTVYLKSDGTVWTWGSNNKGQLGNGTTTDSSVPLQVGSLTGITAIAAGNEHSVALKSDGTVWTWGSNSKGQLGNGTITDSTTPVKVNDLTGIIAVAAGDEHSVALKSDGMVWTWGSNSKGQLGNGTTTDSPKAVLVSGLTGGVAIAAGNEHSVAMRYSGSEFTVLAWGSNSKGQLGNGTLTDSKTIVLVSGLTGVTAIAAGDEHTAALKIDGTIWGCGSNSKGQLGNGTLTDSKTIVRAGSLTGITAIAAGNAHSAALKGDGTVWAWGDNSRGQLGNGTFTDSASPVEVPAP